MGKTLTPILIVSERVETTVINTMAHSGAYSYGLTMLDMKYAYNGLNIAFSVVENYMEWLVREVDDETAMEYVQKPSPDLPDDAVIAVFYTDVWNLLSGRVNLDEIVREMYLRQKVTKTKPFCIKKRFFYKSDYQLVELPDDYLQKIKKRAPDQSLVELIHSASEPLSDSTIIAKIYGDIWQNGPLFRQCPEE